MKTYAIGDLQGCYNSFRRLLDLCEFDPAQDRLWLVGDLVNRGSQSLETLRFVKALGSSAITVLGNHDLYLLMVAEGNVKKRGKDDTLEPILQAPDREELLTWLRKQPLCHIENHHCLVHAGLLPQWTAPYARTLAAEVEKVLQGPHYHNFLSHLWGSKPASWSPDLAGMDRLRIIVNAMTRIRLCTPQGQMNFDFKGDPDHGPAGYLPWFEVPGRKSADWTLVTGHWSALGLRQLPNLMTLDSGCLWGGCLSAIRLEDRKVFQIDCKVSEKHLQTPPHS